MEIYTIYLKYRVNLTKKDELVFIINLYMAEQMEREDIRKKGLTT
jgi:hypothetical protein